MIQFKLPADFSRLDSQQCYLRARPDAADDSPEPQIPGPFVSAEEMAGQDHCTVRTEAQKD
jgi:hypothetical protein